MLLHMPIVAKEWSYETMKQWYMRLEEVYIGEYIYIYIYRFKIIRGIWTIS